MPRLLVLALWLLATPAFALSAIVFDGPQHGAACTYTGPGDIKSGAVAWWGLRAYSCTMADGTHTAINLKRTDTHTCDVFLNTSGALGNTTGCSTGGENGTAVATWCNATTCKIEKFYDQSGNSRDALANDDVGGPVTLTFSPTKADFTSGLGLCTAGTLSLPQPATVSAVLNPSNTGAIQAVVGAADSLAQSGISTTSGKFFFYAGSSVVDVTVTGTFSAYHDIQVVFNGASSHFYVDNTDNTGNPGAGSSTATVMCFGSQAEHTAPSGNPYKSLAREAGIWASAFSAGDVSSMSSNQHSFWSF